MSRNSKKSKSANGPTRRPTKTQSQSTSAKATTKVSDKKKAAVSSNRKMRAPEGMRGFTVDGFDNFISRLGLNNNNTLSGGTYEFNLITRNRILLEAAYRGSWIVGAVVDNVADDMTREGVNVATSENDQNLELLYKEMVRLQIWQSIGSAIKWGRLYGGALGVLQIEGQNPATPLRLDTIAKGQFKGIAVYDRWLLNPVLNEVILDGPQIGLPAFYQIVTPLTSSSPINSTPTGQIAVHHSRVFRIIGNELPYLQAITEMMWGESVLERLWDRLISFDNATLSAASLVDRANLRTISVAGLRDVIASGAEAKEGLLEMFEMIRAMQTNEGLTLIDAEDKLETTAYSFAGLADMLLQFAQQLSGATGIPLVRLFSQSPSGLNASGDTDLRMYYDNIAAWQKAKLREPVETILKVMWRSVYGVDAPADMDFTFNPLWQMDAKDKAEIAKTETETVIGAYETGLVPAHTAMKELRDSSGDTGLFSNITDEEIKEAELEPPPLPGEGGDAEGDSEEAPKDEGKPEEKEPVKNLDHKPKWWHFGKRKKA